MTSQRRLALNMFAGIVNNVARVGLQVVMLPLMARLLGPEELGLTSLAFPILYFVLLISDAGLANSLAREKGEGTLVWSSAFWGLLGLSVVLAVSVYGASFLIGAAAHQPRLPMLMAPLCLAIVLAGLTVVPMALMFREGKMSHGSMFDLGATLIGAVVAIYAAFKGAGAWALIIQSLVYYVIRFALYTSAFPFRPRFEFSVKSLMGHTNVGGAMVSSRLLEMGGRVSENSIVSRGLGAASLGAYGYANQIGRFFVECVSNAIWSNLYYLTISRETDKARDDYLNAQRMLAMAIAPMAAICVPLLPMFLPLLFGPRWGESIGPMMILIGSYPFFALGSQIQAILLARSKTKFVIWTAIAANAARVVVVVALMNWGLIAIAWGLALINVLYHAAGALAAKNALKCVFRDQLDTIRGPIVSALIANGCLFLLMSGVRSPVVAIEYAVLCFCGYAAALFLFDRARAGTDVRTLVGLVRRKFA